MKPVTVSVEVAAPRSRVYEHLDVLANHAAFLDHALVDWEFSGPQRGVGARARARSNAVSSQDWTEFEVLESDDEHIVEEGVGNGGKRGQKTAIVSFNSRYQPGTNVYIGSYKPDPQYRDDADSHDIAVVVFKSPIPGIKPARLPGAA